MTGPQQLRSQPWGISSQYPEHIRYSLQPFIWLFANHLEPSSESFDEAWWSLLRWWTTFREDLSRVTLDQVPKSMSAFDTLAPGLCPSCSRVPVSQTHQLLLSPHLPLPFDFVQRRPQPAQSTSLWTLPYPHRKTLGSILTGLAPHTQLDPCSLKTATHTS